MFREKIILVTLLGEPIRRLLMPLHLWPLGQALQMHLKRTS